MRRSLPLGAEGLLALVTAYALYALSAHAYCDQGTQDSRRWPAVGLLVSVPVTWLLAGRREKGARGAAWAVIVVRLLLAVIVFLLLQPYSADRAMEC